MTKIVKYIGVGICLLIALVQIKAMFGIIGIFPQSQEGMDSAYSMGKLSGHLFLVIIMLLIALKIYNSTKN